MNPTQLPTRKKKNVNQCSSFRSLSDPLAHHPKACCLCYLQIESLFWKQARPRPWLDIGVKTTEHKTDEKKACPYTIVWHSTRVSHGYLFSYHSKYLCVYVFCCRCYKKCFKWIHNTMSSLQQTGRFLPFGSNIQRKQLSSQGTTLYIHFLSRLLYLISYGMCQHLDFKTFFFLLFYRRWTAAEFEWKRHRRLNVEWKFEQRGKIRHQTHCQTGTAGTGKPPAKSPSIFKP